MKVSFLLPMIFCATLGLCQDRSPLEKPAIAFEGTKYETPFVPGRVGACIYAMANGHRVALTIDTGAQGYMHVSEEFAERLKLPKVGKIEVGAGTDATKYFDLVEIDELMIGPMRVHKIVALVLPFNTGRRKGEPEYDGIVGFDLFQDLLLTLDFPHKKVVLENRLLEASMPHCIPLKTVANHPGVDMIIGGREVEVALDSGNGGGFDMPSKMADELKLTSPLTFTGMVATVTETRLRFTGELDGFLEVGGHKIMKPKFDFSAIFSYLNAGSDFMQPFIIRFDSRSKLVQFEKPSS